MKQGHLKETNTKLYLEQTVKYSKLSRPKQNKSKCLVQINILIKNLTKSSKYQD